MTTTSESKGYKLSEKDRVSAERTLGVLIQSMANTLDRHDRIRDPVTRNTLLLDKLCIGIDTLTAVAVILPEKYGLDQDLCDKIVKVAERTKKQILELFDWVQNPIYSPEHPIGKNMMIQSKENFEDGIGLEDEKRAA